MRAIDRNRLLLTSAVVTAVWAALVLAFGGLHFDDFVNIAESRGALSVSLEELRTPAFDGRWQPLKRATFDLLAGLAGLTYWPYALALAGAHLFMAGGVAFTARAIWGEGHGWLGAAMALVTLNLSAYSVANVGSLHGILSVALAVWSAGAAIRAARRSVWTARAVALAAAAAVAACLYKETGVVAAVFAAYGMWLAPRTRPGSIRAVMQGAAAPCLGIAAYFAVRVALDVPLFPPDGRYAPASPGVIFRNAALIAAGVIPWGAAAWLGAARGTRGQACTGVSVMVGVAIAAVLPSLMLPWQSPNFWYAGAPAVALGITGLLRHAPRPGRAGIAIAGLAIATLAACIAVTWRTGAHQWGRYSESAIADWTSRPREGGRVVWYDLDTRAEYGGLARTIGPGQRLSHALRLASGDASLEAVACISVLVGPPCDAQTGDEMYLHSRGRLTPVAVPPPGAWFVMP